jgi:hypothetical protein
LFGKEERITHNRRNVRFYKGNNRREAVTFVLTFKRHLQSNTPSNIEKLFHSSGWTDGLPIVLPTEAGVAEMLKGTSHKADELVGSIRPSPPHEAWEYTVEMVATNEVIAGPKPEYFPVILALASTGVTSLFTSTTSFARMMWSTGL